MKQRVTTKIFFRLWVSTSVLVISMFCFLAPSSKVQAVDGDELNLSLIARRLHVILTGVDPELGVLNSMTQILRTGWYNPSFSMQEAVKQAAYIAVSTKYFYDIGLRSFFQGWSNRFNDRATPLNDMVATLIGGVRDGVDFRDLFTEDLIYLSTGGSAYALDSNSHFDSVVASGLSLYETLVARPQSQVYNTGNPNLANSILNPALSFNDSDEFAGVVTTRGWGVAFFDAGTNRRNFEYIAQNLWCKTMEDLSDTSIPGDFIRRDVSRSPGGDEAQFHSTCKGCHGLMDAMSNAFAFWGFNGRFFYQGGSDQFGKTQNDPRTIPNQVATKMNINYKTFPEGSPVVDNHWVNYMALDADYKRNNPNEERDSQVTWTGSVSHEGRGINSLLREAVGSSDFPRCAVKKVFAYVCNRPPGRGEELEQLLNIADNEFVGAMHYNLKELFVRLATLPQCLGVDDNFLGRR